MALLSMQRHSWEQGVAAHAAIDAGEVALAKALGREAMARQDDAGMLAATGDIGLVNGAACGEVVALLAAEGEAGAAEALERQRWWILRDCPRAESGALFHLADLEELWVDTVYHVVPFLVLTGDFAPADMQYRLHKSLLWHEDTGLYGHRRNAATGDWVREVPWASGNGWVAAGLTRALHLGGDRTPQEMRSRWQREARALLDACAAHERPDGRFHDVLDDPATFVDGTAGLMLAYAAFTGVAAGWLEVDYALSARRWMDAALAHVDENGLVREVCGCPHFTGLGTSSEAQAFALLALAAARRLELPHGFRNGEATP